MVSSTSLATQCRVVLYGDNCVVCVRDTLTVYVDDLCYGQYTGKLVVTGGWRAGGWHMECGRSTGRVCGKSASKVRARCGQSARGEFRVRQRLKGTR